jgi:hypothetical protein
VGVVSGALQSNRPATGSVSVTVHGASMGLTSVSASSRAGLDTCQSTTWASDSSIVCLAHESGAAGSRRVLLTTALSVSSATGLLSWPMPVLSSLLQTNVPRTGSSWVTVQGVHAGLVGGSAWVSVGLTACGATVWESDTSVRCEAGAGMAGSRVATMSAGGRVGSVSRGVSVDVPTMSGGRMANGAGTGGVRVTLQGGGLGLAGYSVSGRTGQSGGVESRWASDTSPHTLRWS